MGNRYVPVEGYPYLVRDMESNAILNTDRVRIRQAVEKRQRQEQRDLELKKDRERLDNLESDISEIKEALNILLQKTHK